MELMQKPGVMSKLQQIMSNPAAAVQMMSDPDMVRVLSKLQQIQLGAGGGAGACCVVLCCVVLCCVVLCCVTISLIV